MYIIITERLRSIFQILIFIIHTHFCGRVASAHNTHTVIIIIIIMYGTVSTIRVYVRARALGYPVLVENKGFIIIIVIISFFF